VISGSHAASRTPSQTARYGFIAIIGVVLAFGAVALLCAKKARTERLAKFAATWRVRNRF
jgi:hypothetical protein